MVQINSISKCKKKNSKNEILYKCMTFVLIQKDVLVEVRGYFLIETIDLSKSVNSYVLLTGIILSCKLLILLYVIFYLVSSSRKKVGFKLTHPILLDKMSGVRLA